MLKSSMSTMSVHSRPDCRSNHEMNQSPASPDETSSLDLYLFSICSTNLIYTQTIKGDIDGHTSCHLHDIPAVSHQQMQATAPSEPSNIIAPGSGSRPPFLPPSLNGRAFRRKLLLVWLALEDTPSWWSRYQHSNVEDGTGWKGWCDLRSSAKES